MEAESRYKARDSPFSSTTSLSLLKYDQLAEEKATKADSSTGDSMAMGMNTERGWLISSNGQHEIEQCARLVGLTRDKRVVARTRCQHLGQRLHVVSDQMLIGRRLEPELKPRRRRCRKGIQCVLVMRKACSDGAQRLVEPLTSAGGKLCAQYPSSRPGPIFHTSHRWDASSRRTSCVCLHATVSSCIRMSQHVTASICQDVQLTASGMSSTTSSCRVATHCAFVEHRYS